MTNQIIPVVNIPWSSDNRRSSDSSKLQISALCISLLSCTISIEHTHIHADMTVC